MCEHWMTWGHKKMICDTHQKSSAAVTKYNHFSDGGKNNIKRIKDNQLNQVGTLWEFKSIVSNRVLLWQVTVVKNEIFRPHVGWCATSWTWIYDFLWISHNFIFLMRLGNARKKPTIKWSLFHRLMGFLCTSVQ